MIRFIAILIFATLASARAETFCETKTREGVAEFSAAYAEWDAARFSKSIALFQQAAAACANVTNQYWVGAAQFHLMLQLNNSPEAVSRRDDSEAALNDAIKNLNAALKLDPEHAESHALLGTLYGMKIGDSFLRGGWFGPRLVKHHEAAIKFGKDNPRVVYLTGMCQFHTADKPPKWREALATLLKAEKLFEAEAKLPVSGFEPRWGYSSCLTFIAKSYETLSEREKALDYFRRALEAHPADHLARAGVQRLSQKK